MHIKEINSDSVTIGWGKPIDDGGLDISSYQVERCNVGKMIWSKVADVGHDISAYSVQKLHEDSEYMFRVCAQNAVGASEFLASEPVTVKCRYRKYKININLQYCLVKSHQKERVYLNWYLNHKTFLIKKIKI